jgi:eukaryotic-like serine/threonine-protein kinase
LIGRTLSHYQITAALGAGGMGQVWRATDTQLGREVAIKVLPPEVARDPERLARFRREARLLAALNHPNIAAIHGLDEDGQPFLVLELVDGEDLAVRLRRGLIPVGEAIELARQIAEALEEAHAKGIVHRDLKPGNVKVTAEGRVKVLDFGLAKAYGGDATDGVSSADVSQSPTLARSGTLAGVILGTARYMSPEQASGKPVDRRTDIWAFGVVLFEMLTGKPLFTGETPSEILACVIKEEPPWDRLPADCPGSVRRLLRRCLRKRVRERLQDIGDARLELSDPAETPPAATSEAVRSITGDEAAPRVPMRERLAWITAGVLGTALAVLAFRPLPTVREGVLPAHFVIEVPEGASFADLEPVAVSPDGQKLAFVATPPGATQTMVWIRSLDSLAARPLPGTEGGSAPFWSPDSGSVGFFAPSDLKTIHISGGTAQRVCALPGPYNGSGTWSPSGTIVFASGAANARLVSVAATGGEAKPIATVDAPQGSPQFLPDGRRLLFVINGTPEMAGSYVLSLDRPGEARRILPETGLLRYARPGHLLLVRDGTLLAQPFDESRLRVTGDRVVLAQSVDSFSYVRDWGSFSASSNGVLAYMTRADNKRQLAWLDRNGRRLGKVGNPAAYGQIVIAPDQHRVAAEIQDADGQYDLWVIDLARGVASRVTFDPLSERDPVWAPDSRELAYTVVRDGRWHMFRKSLVGNEAPSPLLESPIDVYVKSWSADGKALLYVTNDGKETAVWALSPAGDANPERLFGSTYLLEQPQLSPDGRWLALLSNESGRFEVYIQPFRRPGERVRVSTDGGGQPVWRGDGKELFYLSLDGRLMAVDVRAGAAGIEVGLPKALFGLGRYEPDFYDYAPSADGQRVLAKMRVENDPGRRLHVVINWPSLLR